MQREREREREERLSGQRGRLLLFYQGASHLNRADLGPVMSADATYGGLRAPKKKGCKAGRT